MAPRLRGGELGSGICQIMTPCWEVGSTEMSRLRKGRDALSPGRLRQLLQMRAWLWPIQMLIGASPRPLSASAQGTFSRASTSPYLAIGLCPSIGDTCGVFPLTLGMSLAKKKQGRGRAANGTDVVRSWRRCWRMRGKSDACFMET